MALPPPEHEEAILDTFAGVIQVERDQGRVHPCILLSLFFFAAILVALGSTASLAQPAPAAADVVQPTSQPSGQAAIALPEAFEPWRDALERFPTIVSLGEMEKIDPDGEVALKALRDRLTLLGRKEVSNRQWRDYWSSQKALATTLSTSSKATHPSWAPVLAKWAALAEQKTLNQDVYLDAIQAERDALEEWLEALTNLKSPELGADGSQDTLAAELSPFKRRQRRLKELKGRVALQERKLAIAKMLSQHCARQIETNAVTDKARKRDLDLAKLERAIAEEVTLVEGDAWSETWVALGARAADKTKALADEVALGQQRARALEVEASLLKSQIEYRANKRAAFAQSRDELNSIEGWLTAVGETVVDWTFARGWQVLLLLFALWLGTRLALRLLSVTLRSLLKAVEDDDPDDTSAEEARAQTIASVFGSVVRVAIYIVAGLIALETIGIDTGPILGSFAILGLAISFGSQNLVRDVVNGFFILLENQYAVGDIVTVAGNSGTVESINLRATRVREFDGTLHVIPNGQISAVANVSRDWSRIIIDVGVGYDADLRQVEKVLTEVGEAMAADPDWSEIFQEPPSVMGVIDLADSAVVVRVIAKTEACEHWGSGRELKARIKEALSEAGIDIPFPQRVIHHIGKEAPPE